MKREEQDISTLLKKSLPSAQQEQEVGKRVFYRLLLARSENSVNPMPDDEENGALRTWPRFSIAIAATALLASFLFVLLLTNGRGKTAEKLSGESVRATNAENQILDLPDGSRAEVRAQSQFQIEQAVDGLRLRLSDGSVIMTAAKQGAGHLYVETNDAMVSVVGTVFVVSVEQNGSRVGVFEGVVKVQHGAISEELLRGQQSATDPAMGSVSLDRQVSWSRNAASYLALLQQPIPPTQTRIAAATPPAPLQARPVASSQNTQEEKSLLIVGAGRRATTPEAERGMEQAMTSPEPIPDVAFMVETDYFQLNRAEYLVPVTLKIPGTQLTGSKSAKRISLDIVAMVTDDYGAHVANVRDAIDIQLSDETAADLPMRQITYQVGFTLLPGKYSIKFLVHDGITDRIGTYQTAVLIPNLSKDGNNLPISSVILSSELINPSDVLANSSQPQTALEPLTIEGKKLIPNVTRTFSKRRDLFVFLQAYEPNATATEPLTAFVTLSRGQSKVLETPPVAIKDDLGRRIKTLSVKLPVSLTSLAVGTYECQVTVLNPATQKSAVWRSTINVVN
jgi:FecR-like protein